MGIFLRSQFNRLPLNLEATFISRPPQYVDTGQVLAKIAIAHE